MNKQEYLNNPIVRKFLVWLSDRLNNDYFHDYLINENGPTNRGWITFNRGTNWNCTSIFDAYQKYFWGKEYSDFKSNSAILNTLKELGNYGINTNNNDIISIFCQLVFKWGGVQNNNNYVCNYPNNTGFVNLLDEISNAKSFLNPSIYDDANSFPKIKLNAGFTKVYSLLIDDFIIYDSRVAKALCKMISDFLAVNNQNRENYVHPLLAFKIPRGRGDMGKDLLINNRFSFQLFNNNNVYHQVSNLRASWILHEILNLNPHSNFNTFPPDQRLRALEAAFFMIGYRI